MRKLKLQMQLSIDGFVAGPNGQMDWMEWNWDQGLKDFVGELLKPIDTILLGRKLAEGFIPHWEAALAKGEEEGAAIFVNTPKIVFTRTMNQSPWKRTELAKGDLVTEVNAVKAANGGDIVAFGGGEFVGSLIKENLIDEYNLLINPTAIGEGMPIFNQVKGKLGLKPEETRVFDCGVVLLRYRKAE